MSYSPDRRRRSRERSRDRERDRRQRNSDDDRDDRRRSQGHRRERDDRGRSDHGRYHDRDQRRERNLSRDHYRDDRDCEGGRNRHSEVPTGGRDQFFDPSERERAARERAAAINQRMGYSGGGDRRAGGGAGGTGGGRGRHTDEKLPELYTVSKAKVANVRDFGAFVSLEGFNRQGLLHISNISQYRVEDVASVLEEGDEIWVKVISVDEDGGKYAVAMKYVNQRDGQDLDPTNIKLGDGDKRRLTETEKKSLAIGAVLNAHCTKCGQKGHLNYECFSKSQGGDYDLVPEHEETDDLLTDPSVTGQIDSLRQALEVLKEADKLKKEKKRKKKERKKQKKRENRERRSQKRSKRRRHSSDHSSSSDYSSDENRKRRKRKH